MKNSYNIRSLAATAIADVLDKGQSLSTILPKLQKTISDKDRGLLQELSFGTLRVLPQLEWCVKQLMERPLTGKQRTLHYLILVGLYQLTYTRIPPHAALAETVNGAVALRKPQMKGLINGVLRTFQRQQEQLITASLENEHAKHLHPTWLYNRIKAAYPNSYQQILDANNQKPPMWLRVNQQHNTTQQYLELLKEVDIEVVAHPVFPHAIRLLAPCGVNLLPGFEQGWVTVQDASAQGCVTLLAPENGEDILDLCAAPGGKTTYILEMASQANVLAVDIDEMRLKRVKENLNRLNQNAEVKQGDGRFPAKWAADRQFDRILLDAPCSATGVIRRHPDIKWLRRDNDIAELAQLQGEILEAIWPTLKPGGTLVYATCSILPDENSQQIKDFLARHKEAKHDKGADEPTDHLGYQNLPHPENGDGFYYIKLIKL